MKILLVEPPRVLGNANIRILGSVGQYKGNFCWPPLDLTIIAGLLRKNGIESDILDANASMIKIGDVKSKIKAASPDLVLFSTSTSTIGKDVNVAKVAKKVSNDITTVAIGAHIAAEPRETMKSCKELDMLVADPEPEMSVLRLIQKELRPQSVPGMFYRRGKSFVRNRSKKHMNLDDFGIPAHDKVDAKLYSDPLMVRKPMALTYSSRGCRWGRCIYCCNPYFYQPVRFRSIPLITEELKWLNEMGIHEIKWFDPEFNNNLKHTFDLCKSIIRNKIDISWAADMRVDIMSPKILNTMKKAGCHTILIGVESGDEKMLKTIKKGITLDMARRASKMIRKSNLRLITHFMLGLPGETKETMQKTLDFAKDLDPDATTFGIAVPHPGTEFTKFIEDGNYFTTKDYNKYDTSSPPVFNYPQLSSDEIYDFMKYAYREFYFRPGYIARRAMRVKSFTEFKTGLINFKSLLKKYMFGK